MILRILSLLFVVSTLYGAADEEKKVTVKFEVGMYSPTIGGTISNSATPSTFKDDFAYQSSKATYAAAELLLNYDYVPNASISYFNMQEKQDSTLSKSLKVADVDFNSTVSSIVNYEVFNFTLYQDFKNKGAFFTIFGKHFYSGDVEFDVGVNTKLFLWKFQVTDTSTTSSPSWIEVKELIALPYLGFKYYLYDFIAYASVSALSLKEASSSSYQAGLEYKVMKNLYFNASYLQEQFTVVELLDTVDFTTSGYRFGVEYAF